jgi:hypothetical protein
MNANKKTDVEIAQAKQRADEFIDVNVRELRFHNYN